MAEVRFYTCVFHNHREIVLSSGIDQYIGDRDHRVVEWHVVDVPMVYIVGGVVKFI